MSDYPYPCDYCGTVIRCLADEGLAYNMGATPERYCVVCAPPSNNPEDTIRLFNTFMRKDGELK